MYALRGILILVMLVINLLLDTEPLLEEIL